jgi:hypothetical protein
MPSYCRLTERKCLGCQEPFLSKGPGNRICPRCESKQHNLSVRESSPGARTAIDLPESARPSTMDLL